MPLFTPENWIESGILNERFVETFTRLFLQVLRNFYSDFKWNDHLNTKISTHIKYTHSARHVINRCIF